jgi:FtsH-binding integral membrane protein
MEDKQPEYREAEKDDGIIRTLQKNVLSLTLLAIAGVCVVIMFMNGSIKSEDAKAIMIWLILILVMLSIIFMMREKLMMALILYGVFAGAYLVEGYIISATGVSDNFSWGVLTFGLFSIFVYVVGLQKNFTQKHIWIFLTFIITAWLLNEGDWMSQGNEITAELMSKLAGGFSTGIIWR